MFNSYFPDLETPHQSFLSGYNGMVTIFAEGFAYFASRGENFCKDLSILLGHYPHLRVKDCIPQPAAANISSGNVVFFEPTGL